MKSFTVFVFVACALFCVTSPLLAGGIDNKTNYSADYIRSLNRNAATDSADAVVYNPAGVMKMEDGMYVKLDLQYTAIKEATNHVFGTEFESDATDFVPALFAVYKNDRWAAFADFSIPAGGGSVEFEQGNATTTRIGSGVIQASEYYSSISNQYLEGKSVYYGYTVGGAYAFNDIFSMSLAARYINAEKEANGFATVSGLAPAMTLSVDYEQDDNGLGFILGANIAPSENWNIGLRYESKTGLDLEYTVNGDDLDGLMPGGALPPTGFAQNRDLPAILGLGASWMITPKFKVEADLTYYLNENADWTKPKFSYVDMEWSEEKIRDVDDGYDLGVALEYTFSPKLKTSVGYLLTKTGLDPDGMLPEWPELDAHSFAAGFSYKLNTAWTLNAGLSKTFYGDETTSSTSTDVLPLVTLEKDVMLMAVGIQYRF